MTTLEDLRKTDMAREEKSRLRNLWRNRELRRKAKLFDGLLESAKKYLRCEHEMYGEKCTPCGDALVAAIELCEAKNG